ncbi:hypothetical protein FHL15_007678 [Xylaria flabelliformis]|uniref:N-alpha-acetyltransferase 40 n=1 Tax=Xylaria flabelliformis TaxID=2512241 RepID=A0A553HU43_9PEZI|nr:hypothetical protein FHL15_007678 [Xylaria flabelliformis]
MVFHPALRYSHPSDFNPASVLDVMTTSKENAKRKRAMTDPIDKVNEKNDEKFIQEHLRPSADLDACYNLIEETSRPDYEASSTFDWKPVKKMAEMKSPELRYILVKNSEGDVRGFTSLMPTYEEGEPVVYCYEIHLKPELRGTGLGRLLMSFLESVAAHTPPIKKVMLTCFLTNRKALAFYKSMGFVQDPISPVPKKLRYGREFIPDYVIMSKSVESKAVLDTASS